MAEFTVALAVGIAIGGNRCTEAVMRDATVDDILHATANAERLVMVPVGVDDDGKPVHEPQLVVSPTECGINTLCRQIVRIGKLQGPFSREMLNQLAPQDVNLLQRAVQQREQAALQAVAQRGRNDSAGAGANASA